MQRVGAAGPCNKEGRSMQNLHGPAHWTIGPLLSANQHPLLGPLCLALHCKNSGGFRPWPPVVVFRDKQWFQTTTVTPLVPEKHQWRSESNTVLQCTPAQTLYTSLSTLAKFKLTPYIQDVNGLNSVQSAAAHAPWCTPDCNFWLFRLSSLALSCTTVLCNLATVPTQWAVLTYS